MKLRLVKGHISERKTGEEPRKESQHGDEDAAANLLRVSRVLGASGEDMFAERRSTIWGSIIE